MKESLLLFYMFVDGRSVNQWAISKNVALSQETEFIEEVSGLTEKGEIQETAQTDSITQSIAMDQTYSQGRFKVVSNRGRGQARGRGGRSFARTNRWERSIWYVYCPYFHLREPSATDRYT